MADPTPTSAATEAPATPAVDSDGADASGAQDLILKVAGAIGTGIGVLGFVTLFGGAILWIRAEEANLPANDAISAVPNSVLVTTGASFLVPAVLISLFALAVIFVFHLCFEVPRKSRQRGTFESAQQLHHDAEEMERQAGAKTQLAQAVRAQATHLGDIAEQLNKAEVSQTLKDAAAKEAGDKRLEAEVEEAAALLTVSEAATAKAEADNLQAASEFALKRSYQQFLTELGVGALVLLVVPVLCNQTLFHVSFFWSGLILVAVGVLTVAISLVTYVETERFVWFGVVAFITVGIYIGFATYFNTTGNPKVEPAAALRSGHPPVIGIYIADTASNLYLGSFPEQGKPSRLMVLPRAQITDLSIGPLLDRQVARQRAAEIAAEECEQVITKPAPEPASPPSSENGSDAQATSAPIEEAACTKTQRATLHPYLG
jgi:uncharacterized membrane protein YhiD involved in acid resistance